MSKVKSFAFAGIAAALFCCVLTAPKQAQAQIAVGINIGVPPVCPYGYFSYPPYDCAPYGYYGPDWWVNGVFIGAGPWFHGPRGFAGHVDNRYDPHYGYHGPLPARGDRPNYNFHGNEARDGRGHVVADTHSPANEHALPGYRGGHASSHGGHR